MKVKDTKYNNIPLLVPTKLHGELLTSFASLNKPKIEAFSIEKVFRLIHLIGVKSWQDNDSPYDEWATLKMEILRMYLHDAVKYIRWMLRVGIIERSKTYTVGERSYQYRIHPDYISKITEVTLTDVREANKERLERDRRAKKQSRKYPVFRKAVSDLYIMHEAAMTDIDDKFKEALLYTKTLEEKRKLINMYNAYYYHIYAFRYRDLYSKCGQFGHRYYNNWTGLPRVLRPFIRLDHKPIATVDIGSSQFLMLVMVIQRNPLFYQISEGLIKEKRIDKKTLSTCTELLTAPEAKDLQRFIYFVKEGIYDKMIEVFASHGMTYTRDEVKIEMMRIVGSSNKFNHDPKGKTQYGVKPKRIFEAMFPTVANLLRVLKEKDKETPQMITTRMESRLILEVIPAQIFSENPFIKLLPLHDNLGSSLSTGVNGSIPIIKRAMNDVFTELLGFPPKLKTETFEFEKRCLTNNYFLKTMKTKTTKQNQPLPTLKPNQYDRAFARPPFVWVASQALSSINDGEDFRKRIWVVDCRRVV